MNKARSGHSNFRKGLSDYNDGENVTHYLGNTDYNGANLSDADNHEQQNLDGQEAQGNAHLEEEEEQPENYIQSNQIDLE